MKVELQFMEKGIFLHSSDVAEAVEVLSKEYAKCNHFAKYPQDRWKNDPIKTTTPDIATMIQTASYNENRANRLKKVIDFLKNS